MAKQKAIITNYNSPYFPIKIEWDHGKKSTVVESIDVAIKYIKSFLPLDTRIIDKTEGGLEHESN